MDLLSKVQLHTSELTKNEKKACDAIMNDLTYVQSHSLAELSEAIGITKTSILRFCQKLGYSGYSEFKYDVVSFVNSRGESSDPAENRLTQIEDLYANAIRLIHHAVTEEEVSALAGAIKKADHVYLLGQINSEVSALQLRYALLMYGINATVIRSGEEMHSVDMCIKKSDLIIAYSVSARKESLKDAVSIAEQTGCTLALVTMNAAMKENPAYKHCIQLPQIGADRKSLLQDVPVFSVFNEMLLSFLG